MIASLSAAYEAVARAIAASQSIMGGSAEQITCLFLLQLIVILAATRLVVWGSTRMLGQTAVAGEILAGLLLGPSALGAWFPGAMHRLFAPSTSTIFIGFSQLGLVLLMFQIGMEFEFKRSLAQSRRALTIVSVGSIALPFALGYWAAPWFWARLPDIRPDLLAFRLFFAMAMSITAVPILGRIMMELHVSHTRTAALTIGAAAINDIAGWLVLGVAGAVVGSAFDIGSLAMRIALLAAYMGLVLGVVKPVASRLIQTHVSAPRRLSARAVSIVLLGLLASAEITSRLGVFAIIGGFIVGFALHEDRVFVELWKQRVSGLVDTLFLPLFFVYTGLRTDVTALHDPQAWMEGALICAIAFAGKFGGGYLSARAAGEDRRCALIVGVCMNTRGLMELIVLNIGYDLGVFPKQMFTTLVVMAAASTFIATPLIRRLIGPERIGGEIPGIAAAHE